MVRDTFKDTSNGGASRALEQLQTNTVTSLDPWTNSGMCASQWKPEHSDWLFSRLSKGVLQLLVLYQRRLYTLVCVRGVRIAPIQHATHESLTVKGKAADVRRANSSSWELQQDGKTQQPSSLLQTAKTRIRPLYHRRRSRLLS